ncbi:hypothetical protein DENIS_3045 [Desulfonema ishimotonii]|uniref:Aminoglycoside phosphotransferase domain-containing protein n=1 Tax=Desulfonema ishimotonii TaxID=45657 RepID=A0A401FYK4_9BACT|nr:AAA family ATPase [Desulfonema ishimotonii]GBC62082.1 hypothetical protein DENIS_3045 [Desulfonema ishimotonii]
MNPQAYFESVCSAMADPAFYPHPVSGLKRLDTHISAVFLTGDHVYKLKKPLEMGFLDFREPDARRHFCENEVTLNRRLSKGIYETVVPIFESGTGTFSLTGGDRVAEYAVRMRQLPDGASLKNRLRNGTVSENDMVALGELLADFYRKSGKSREIDRYGEQDVISFNMEENFRQLAPFAGKLFDVEKWQFICGVCRSFFEHHPALFGNRVATGKIRDGHGDLRADHVYFHDGIQIIDCIEFNDRFRYGDVVSDLAFLHMDMARLGGESRGRAFIRAYARQAEDPGVCALLDFYAAYRAVVRLKIACFRHQMAGETEKETLQHEINGYIRLARCYTFRFSRPTLWVLCGLPASGKSRHARRLADALSMTLIQSDTLRKAEQPRPEIVPFGTGQYSHARRQRIYGRMLALAQAALGRGESVILDATYSKRSWREAVRQLAADLNTCLIFTECGCSAGTLRKRLKKRENKTGISDARLEHLEQMADDFDPFTAAEPVPYFRVSTDAPADDVFYDILFQGEGLRAAQAEKLM